MYTKFMSLQSDWCSFLLFWPTFFDFVYSSHQELSEPGSLFEINPSLRYINYRPGFFVQAFLLNLQFLTHQAQAE